MQLQTDQQKSWMYQRPAYLTHRDVPTRRIILPAIRGSQRAFFVGKTRSGKSTMARYLLKEVVKSGGRVFILDPKRDWMGRPPDRKPYTILSKTDRGTVDNPVLVDHFDPSIRVSIYEPAEWDRNCDAIMRDAVSYGYTTIYIDEIKQLVPFTTAPKHLQIAYTQGAAAGVGVWAGVQRPKGVPEVMKDQAEVWFVFRVKKLEDRMDIATYIVEDTEGNRLPTLLRKPLQYRWFLFWEDSMIEPVLCMPLTLNSGGNVIK